MIKRSIGWLKSDAGTKVAVYPDAMLEYCEDQEVLNASFHIYGDGLGMQDNGFTFSTTPWDGQIMPYPLHNMSKLYCTYKCKYDEITAVYEDEEDRAMVFVSGK